MKNKNLIFFLIIFTLLILEPIVSNALAIEDPLGGKTAGEIINAIMSLLVVIGTGVTVIMIIWGGIRYMTSGGNEQATTSAKKTIMWAIIGFAILISAKFIIQAVESVLKGVK